MFGAGFDENWEVKHDCTETVEGLSAFEVANMCRAG